LAEPQPLALEPSEPPQNDLNLDDVEKSLEFDKDDQEDLYENEMASGFKKAV
jgi:hypothetical protein